MPQAIIEINAVVGSDNDLPINTLIQFSNNDIGDESTYFWEILYAPPGNTAALSNPAIENPTLTPDVEGTYLIKLTVDAAIVAYFDQAICGIRQLKTLNRIPAADEVKEDDASDGWAVTMHTALVAHDNAAVDGGLYVGLADAGGLVPGNVLYVATAGTIKAGLPGVETLPSLGKALATDATLLGGPLYFLVNDVAGSGTPGLGDLIIARRMGLTPLVALAGAALKDDVFVSDAGIPALAAGTNRRKVGTVGLVAGGNAAIVWEAGARYEDYVRQVGGNPMELIFAAASTAAGVGHYLNPGGYIVATDGNERVWRVTRDGVLRNLHAWVRAGTHDDVVELVVRIGGVNKSITLTLAAGVVEGDDLVNTEAVLQGEQVSITVVTQGGAASYGDLYATLELTGE